MELTKEQIEEINNDCKYGQGVFREPFGIPSHIKGLVVYSKWGSGGRTGSCWDNEHTVNSVYTNDRPFDSFEVLDKVLKILKPDITYLELQEIEALKEDNIETYPGYYGDYTEDTIEWIELDDIINKLT